VNISSTISFKRIAKILSISIVIFSFGLGLYSARQLYFEATEQYSIPITKLTSKTPQKVVNPSSMDYTCGGERGDEKVSMFKDSLPPRTAEKIKIASNGSSSRLNAVFEVRVEADNAGRPEYVRVLRILSDGIPDKIVGKRLWLDLGNCIRYSAVGETGIIIGTLRNESSDQPVISPY